MSSMGSDEAIEKLSEYRKDTAQKEKDIQDKKKDLPEGVKKIRNFFMKFHWFNAVYLTALATALLITGNTPAIPGPYFFYIVFATIDIILVRQFFITIQRLDDTEGRSTTIDDIFIIVLATIAFLELLPFFQYFDFLNATLYIYAHVFMGLVWLAQIIFINYLKPDLDYEVKKKEKVIKDDEEGDWQEFFTIGRIIALVLGIVIGVGIGTPVLLML